MLKTNKSKNLTGILLQLPVIALAALAALKFIFAFVISLCDVKIFENYALEYVGFENYEALFTRNMHIIYSLANTIVLLILCSLLLALTAVLPALFISRLKTPFGIGVLALYSVISLSVCMNGSWDYITAFIPESFELYTYAIALNLLALAPTFGVTYALAKAKSINYASTLGMVGASVFLTGAMLYTETIVINRPMTLLTQYYSYTNHTFDYGTANAALVVYFVILICTCAVFSLAALGLTALLRLIKLKEKPLNIISYIFFGLSLTNLVWLINPIATMFSSFKTENGFGIDNYRSLFISLYCKIFGENIGWDGTVDYSVMSEFIGFVITMLVIFALILPVFYLIFVFTTASGLALIKDSKWKWLFLLPIPILVMFNNGIFLPNYLESNLGEIYPTWLNLIVASCDTFISGVGMLLLLVLTYVILRKMLEKCENRKKRMILGISSLAASCYSVFGMTLLWSPGMLRYWHYFLQDMLCNMYEIFKFGIGTFFDYEILDILGIDAFDITREVVFAGNTLLLLVSGALVIIPTILLFLFSRSCKKDEPKEITE
ncbi:MAG: hypothetical protein IJ408_06425 [Clostridia bacterium]|nr:hypothetical protein [Clostridia bacterium]MBQ8793916.1 hypothetical protein [Clostridia bacterium]